MKLARDIIELVLCLTILAILAVVFFGRTTEPKFLVFNPDGADDSRGRLEDCFSRLTDKNKAVVMTHDKFGPPDKPNICHEATHFLNSQLRCATPSQNDNAVYIDKGRYLLFEEPKVTLTQVFKYLDADTTAHIDDVMHTHKEWDKEPLYIFDEWSAYINGTTCCIEVNAPAPRLALSRRNMVYASLIADGFIQCIEDHDPTYAQLGELKQFVAWQKIRMNKLRTP